MATWKEKETAIRALEKNGRVEAAALVSAARNEDHPCHDDFEWDDAVAAQKHRLIVAGALIRTCSFKVLIENVVHRTVQYVHHPDGDSGDYHSLPRLKSAEAVSSVMAAEIAALHGHALRALRIAVAKAEIVPPEHILALRKACDLIGAIKHGESVAVAALLA